MELYRSRASYLKTIYLLRLRNEKVRECDIAAAMGYTKVSVCNMMKLLAQQGYVVRVQNDVCLTEAGRETAQAVYEKYCVAREFLLTVLHLPPDRAEQDACALERVLSDEAAAAMKDRLAQEGEGSGPSAARAGGDG